MANFLSIVGKFDALPYLIIRIFYLNPIFLNLNYAITECMQTGIFNSCIPILHISIYVTVLLLSICVNLEIPHSQTRYDLNSFIARESAIEFKYTISAVLLLHR